jgi:UDP-N-acetylmuramate--alanine ligase
MSALARYFVYQNKTVAGYDRSRSRLTDQLQAEGVDVHFSDEAVFDDLAFTDPHHTLVIFTPAVGKDNKLMQYFSSKGFNLLKRAEVLGQITAAYKTIAVAGTHGKTSVSCMAAHLLHQSAVASMAILGGIPANYERNFIYNENAEYAVTEADEFDKSFLKLHPLHAVITATDADHLDIYGTKAMLDQSFAEFAQRVPAGGSLLLKINTGIEISKLAVKQIYTYSLSDSRADMYAKNIKITSDAIHFDMIMPGRVILNLEMQALGLFNVENALAAVHLAIQAGLSEDEIRRGLRTFSGVYRRFQKQFAHGQIVYIDDYAHHPEEINALVQAVRSAYPGRKITGVFQPHLYSRTRDFADEFAQSLSVLDEVILLDIYPAREKPIDGVSSEMIFQKINHQNKTLTSKGVLVEILKTKTPEILLTIGAGDIDSLVAPIRQFLEEKYDKPKPS